MAKTQKFKHGVATTLKLIGLLILATAVGIVTELV